MTVNPETLFYVTREAGRDFVGLNTLAQIHRKLAEGEFPETYYATESDGRSFAQFSKDDAGRWRTLAELFGAPAVGAALAELRDKEREAAQARVRRSPALLSVERAARAVMIAFWSAVILYLPMVCFAYVLAEEVLFGKGRDPSKVLFLKLVSSAMN